MLRPAIPNDEMFEGDGTYGPKANFKISLRELPDDGRFRVTVTAAKYNDGLLLDRGRTAQASEGRRRLSRSENAANRDDPEGGHLPGGYLSRGCEATRRLARTRRGSTKGWPGRGRSMATAERPARRCEGDAQFVDSPFGKAVSLDGDGDSVVVPRRRDAMNVGEGDFTVAAWIHPQAAPKARRSSALAESDWTHGWYLECPTTGHVCGSKQPGRTTSPTGRVSPPGVIRANAWQHVAAVVRRGQERNAALCQRLPGRRRARSVRRTWTIRRSICISAAFRRPSRFGANWMRCASIAGPSDEAEIQALGANPDGSLCSRLPKSRRTSTLTLGDRQFSGTLQQPAFLAVRLAGWPARR